MVSLTTQQRDDIFNALIVGMAPEDAFLFAKLTPDEIAWIVDDAEIQAWIQQTNKSLEFNLLQQMANGAKMQIANGKTDGTQWLLEHLFPRYSAKAAPDVGTVNFILKKEQTEDIETVVGGLTSVVGGIIDDIRGGTAEAQGSGA